MEKIHDADGRSWISQSVSVGDYFKEYSAMVQKEKPVRDTTNLSSNWMMKHMGITDKDTFAKLLNVLNDFIEVLLHVHLLQVY